MPSPEQPAALIDLPPSAKLVYVVLAEEGTLTQAELIENSYLPARTVRDALQRLKDVDAVAEEIDFRDARQRLYSLTTDSEEPIDSPF